MNELRQKVLDLLDGGLPKGTLADVLIALIAESLRRLGGRPRNGTGNGLTHAEGTSEMTFPETSDTHTLSLGSGSGSLQSPEPSEKIGERTKPAPPPGFLEFWGLYPKKVGKSDAERAWRRAKPPITKVRQTLSWQVNCDQWQQGFIPNPATWINRGGWDDEQPPPSRPNGSNGKTWRF